MADHFPLVITSNTIQELPNGDNLNLSGSEIVGANFTGVSTFSSVDCGNATFTGVSTFFGSTGTPLVRITQTGNGNAFIVEDSTHPDSTPFIINSNGSVGIGTTIPLVSEAVSRLGVGDYKYFHANESTFYPRMMVSGAGEQHQLVINRHTTNQTGDGVDLVLIRTRGVGIGSTQALVLNDRIGSLGMFGSDGQNVPCFAGISGVVDGTVGLGSAPGRLVLSTTLSGEDSPSPRLIIYSTGNVAIGTDVLATSAVAGFPWIPSCAGVPSGAPTAPYTNAAALVVDTTNNRLYVRVGSTWKFAALS